MSEHRQQILAALLFRPHVRRNTQHQLLARPIDIRVQQTDPFAQRLERQGQVYRGGGLAHTALAGGHGNNMFDLVHDNLWWNYDAPMQPHRHLSGPLV